MESLHFRVRNISTPSTVVAGLAYQIFIGGLEFNRESIYTPSAQSLKYVMIYASFILFR